MCLSHVLVVGTCPSGVIEVNSPWEKELGEVCLVYLQLSVGSGEGEERWRVGEHMLVQLRKQPS